MDEDHDDDEEIDEEDEEDDEDDDEDEEDDEGDEDEEVSSVSDFFFIFQYSTTTRSFFFSIKSTIRYTELLFFFLDASRNRSFCNLA